MTTRMRPRVPTSREPLGRICVLSENTIGEVNTTKNGLPEDWDLIFTFKEDKKT